MLISGAADWTDWKFESIKGKLGLFYFKFVYIKFMIAMLL